MMPADVCILRLGRPGSGGLRQRRGLAVIVSASCVNEEPHAFPPFHIETGGECLLEHKDVREATIASIFATVTYILGGHGRGATCSRKHIHHPREIPFLWHNRHCWVEQPGPWCRGGLNVCLDPCKYVHLKTAENTLVWNVQEWAFSRKSSALPISLCLSLPL